MNETFEFTDKLKKQLFTMMGIGVLGLVIVFFSHPENQHARFWTNILANSYYFTGIGIFGLFAVAAGTLAYGSWHILVKRIFLSLSAFVKVSSVLLILIVVLGLLNVHTIYGHINAILHESHVSETHTTKVIYFAPMFWISRLVAYAFLWSMFSWGMNKFFGRTDQTDPKVYKKAKLISAAFIVTFAVTESAASWDYIMCVNSHWYSTLFGWYNFASYGCAAWAMTILLVIYLKSKGYMSRVNENHIHDLGKLLFGFCVFWAYLWFDQFMLQWFANVPEETGFWVKRFNNPYFTTTIFLTLFTNFVFPFLFLLRRGAKRNFKMIGFGAAVLILGQYVDFFNYTFVEPNWNHSLQHHAHEAKAATEEVVLYAQAEAHPEAVSDATQATENKAEVTSEVKHHEVATHGAETEGEHGHEPAVANYAGIGIGELFVFIGFLGAFLFAFFRNLAKRPIIPENDPYLKECEKIVVVYS